MIHVIRGERVILDSDLAQLYGVETKVLNKQVQRNIERFPEDFMFQLTNQEFTNLRFQNGTTRWGGARYLPHAFTEEGVAMLSGLLRSPVAIQMNIQIMRAFVYVKNTLSAINETAIRQDKLELEVEKLRDYIEDILHDQNDTNEMVSAQMDAISRSLAELSTKVDDLTHSKRILRKPVGYEAIDAERKAKTNKEEDKDSK
ncbi:MAG: ORF6N domain-containing protein [Paludibacteraceae bacterium]|nr:ORF6N domain-containing protein [Paludibacteraceae bacterium]